MRQSAATLVSFLDNKKELHYVLVRNYHGDFKFAGGLKDKTDKHTGQTALRELKEETGFDKKYYPHAKLRLVDSKSYPASNNKVDLFHLHLGQLSPQKIQDLRHHLSARDDVDELRIVRASQVDFKNAKVHIGGKTYGIVHSNCQMMLTAKQHYQKTNPDKAQHKSSYQPSHFKAARAVSPQAKPSRPLYTPR